MKTPENEKLRHAPGVIDQRQQRIDPANKVTRDPNADSRKTAPDRDPGPEKAGHSNRDLHD